MMMMLSPAWSADAAAAALFVQACQHQWWYTAVPMVQESVSQWPAVFARPVSLRTPAAAAAPPPPHWNSYTFEQPTQQLGALRPSAVPPTTPAICGTTLWHWWINAARPAGKSSQYSDRRRPSRYITGARCMMFILPSWISRRRRSDTWCDCADFVVSCCLSSVTNVL